MHENVHVDCYMKTLVQVMNYSSKTRTTRVQDFSGSQIEVRQSLPYTIMSSPTSRAL